MNTREWIARNLAAAMLCGKWSPRARSDRARHLLGTENSRERTALLRRLAAFADRSEQPPSPDWLTGFFLAAPEFNGAVAHILKEPQILHCVLKPAKFAPAKKFADLKVPKINSSGDLAAWLGLSNEHLEWLSDTRRQHSRTAIPVLQNYRYIFVLKKHGSPRLIEEPKPTLKTIQRRILREILDRVPVHACAHGFVAKRSCVTSAQAHCGEFIVLAADLKDYFTSIPAARIQGIFHAIGYPNSVARLLTGLCTSDTPTSVFTNRPSGRMCDWQTRKLYQQPHLPQGAPTSPALANLVSFSLDRRISGLAARFGAKYTRYADDLAFSGDDIFDRRIDTFLENVAMIAVDEGFTLNAAKTRIMRRSQSQRIIGVTVNDHINLPRDTFDEIKAILHNCRKFGPNTQNLLGIANFEEHLRGRIAWAASLNPARGAKLHAMFNLIRWT